MNLDVIVRMRDLLTGPLRRLRSSLEGISNFARKIGVVGAAVAAISFMGPMREAAAFQQQLIDIAGTANLTNEAAFKFVDRQKAQYEELALLVGQTSDIIASGAGQMIAAGVDRSLIDASIGTIGKAATAANAEFSDMSAVATSLLQTLKVPSDQLESALGGLVVAGKEGAFELKDMARYLPTLTSQMAKFGVTGREAVNFLGAALQIARKGTSDPAEAANNLKNFLSKILAPTTIKNFAGMGVDIQAVMEDAVLKGINPIEAVMQKIVKLTGVSGKEISKMMEGAKAKGLEGADALADVREQLEKIHGAGALGDLFSDMQVMDFLIPFLSNVDEFKRIKNEVAEATGGIIDADFETQMQGLNRQLMIFGEIGQQASREVGLAFGTWMPMINGYLMDGLKWLRELDASTGGMVKQGLALAGAGVLAAAALGALGLVLPLIGAGLSAVLALVSPVGLALAAIAAGAVHVYRNWGSYAPKLINLWGSAKTAMRDLGTASARVWSGMIAAGRGLADRYGPMIGRGLANAWASAKVGMGRLKEVFEGFQKGFTLDLSGLNVDSATVMALNALDAALNGISDAWERMKSFGNGFAPYLSTIGENLGGTVQAFAETGQAIGRMATAIGKLVGIGDAQIGSIFEKIGAFAGGLTGEVTALIRDLARGVAWLADSLAKVLESLANTPDWKAFVPDWVAGAFQGIANAINAVTSAVQGMSYKPGEILPNGVAAGSSADGSDRAAALDDFLNGPGKLPANNNTLPAQAATSTTVGGTINVQVTGPAAVTSVTSDNPSVPIKPNTGRAVGRP